MKTIKTSESIHCKHRFPRFMKVFMALLAAIFFCITVASPADCQISAELISEVRSVQPGESFWVAVCLTMDEGWHTYWRNPGDAGLATTINWSLPDGFEAGEIQWPYPHVFGTGDIVSFGYDNEIYLLTELKTPDTSSVATSAKISAAVEWLACKDMCIPQQAELNVEIPINDSSPEIDKDWIIQFNETRKNLPFKHHDWQITATDSISEIFMKFEPPGGNDVKLAHIFFFPDIPGTISHADEQETTKTETGYILKLKKSPYVLEPLKRLSGVLISSTGWSDPGSNKALQVDIPVYKHLKDK